MVPLPGVEPQLLIHAARNIVKKLHMFYVS